MTLFKIGLSLHIHQENEYGHIRDYMNVYDYQWAPILAAQLWNDSWSFIREIIADREKQLSIEMSKKKMNGSMHHNLSLSAKAL